jgi:hypothetical protein
MQNKPQRIFNKENSLVILLLPILLMLFSCQGSRQHHIRSILSGVCFWDVLTREFNAANIRYTYRLLPDGTCYMYRYHYLNNEKQNSVSPVYEEKGEVDIKWSLKSDSILVIGKSDYKVLTVDKDYLLLANDPSHSFLLQKNCTTFIKD